MLINSIDDCIRVLLDGRTLNGVKIVDRAAEFIDPEKKFLDTPYFQPDRKVTDKDYRYLVAALGKINIIYDDIKTCPYTSEFQPVRLQNPINWDLIRYLNETKKMIYLWAESIYFNNVSLAKKELGEEISKFVEDRCNYSRTNLWGSGYLRYGDEVVDIEPKDKRHFLDNTYTEEEYIQVFKEAAEKGSTKIKVRKDGYFNIGNDAFGKEKMEEVFIGYFDQVSKYVPGNKIVVEYSDKISKLPLRKIDIAFVLYASDVFYDDIGMMGSLINRKPEKFDRYMKKPITELINIFWKRSASIKKKLLGRNIQYVPTHVINILWSLLEAKEEKEEDN